MKRIKKFFRKRLLIHFFYKGYGYKEGEITFWFRIINKDEWRK